MKIVIIGGGAAGFFSAIQIKENNPSAEVIILEKSQKTLQKVEISGGGRCNVTHGCFTPKEFTSFYPRGAKELLGPFHKFLSGDMMQWLEDRGVPLKIEADNRVFPVSNSSQSIIDCFNTEITKYSITVKTGEGVKEIVKDGEYWNITTDKSKYIADNIVIATGSSKLFWDKLAKLGHTIVKPVPSLFTFKVKEDNIISLPGVSVPNASIKILGTKLNYAGPLLITHWGFSGPAILKLSAIGARILADKQYCFDISINWLDSKPNIIEQLLLSVKAENPKQQIHNNNPIEELSKRFWKYFVTKANISATKKWADISKKELNLLVSLLTNTVYQIEGKTTFKEEFVTAGGVDLKEVDFGRFESKIARGIYMAGEVLNIDGLTGGFNFQNAWTGSYCIGKALAD